MKKQTMVYPFQKTRSFHSVRLPLRRERGMALVLVLALLVLITALVVGFFRRASFERTGAHAYFESNRNGILVDHVVSIVQNQIDHASTVRDGSSPVAWATQPGMVRTFNAQGNLLRAYKLYSDKDMVASQASLTEAMSALSDWKSSPAHFVDLNAPVNGIFPILDPKALNYVEGFEINNAPSATPEQPAPMPVRWLYVLEDGTVVAPEGNGRKTTVNGATNDNPIVGRIAFWTDDETCKLNINTASHGSFWDIPRAFSQEERDRMARFQPAAREFQRYPGHPASTSLAPVFGHLFGGPGNLDEEAFARFVFELTPRVELGGSEMGKKVPKSPVQLDHDRLYSSLDELLFDPARQQGILTPQELERAKFFLTARSNAPEVNLFNLPRMAIWPINAGSKKPSTIDRLLAHCATIGGQPYYLQRQNPYSSTADMAGRNRQLYDYINNLLSVPPPGFGNRSFEQKYGADAPQIVTEIFDYIRSSNLYSTAFGAIPYTSGTELPLAPKRQDPDEVPGGGSNPAIAGSGMGQVTPLKVDDTKGFGRLPVISRAVFQLFVSGARMPVVDAAGTPLGKYSTFVPIRRSMTQAEASSASVPSVYGTPKLDHNGDPNTLYGRWKSFLDGKSPYTAENEYHGETAELLTSGIIYFDTFDPMYGYASPRYNFDIRVTFSGPWEISGPGGSGKLNFPDSTLYIRRDHYRAYDARRDNLQPIWTGRHLGGPLLPQWIMQNYAFVRGNEEPVSDSTYNGKLPYPLVSDRVRIHSPITLVNNGSGITAANRDFPLYTDIENQMGNVTFLGGKMTAEILVNNEVVQTYEFEFPPFVKPVPGYDGTASNGSRPLLKQMPVSFDFRHRWQASPHQHRINDSTSNYNYPDVRLVQPKDVAVSLVPRFGDKRLLAAKSKLTMNDFVPHEYYDDSSRRAAVDFREDVINMSKGKILTTHAASKLLDIDYGWNAKPDIPTHLKNGVQNALGLNFPPDFDNGTYHVPDDAYVNRADESSALDAVTSSDYRVTAWYTDNLFKPDNDILKKFRDNESFYSPNRQMPSAVMFGSLPTGVKRNLPWQTLLFRPDPGNHPGAQDPPDYTILDLFWMPIVEPYAISEPFSTNGKVNMNYEIMPFGKYLKRTTALRGVFETEEMLVLEDRHATSGGGADEYKRASSGGANTAWSTLQFRKKINAGETLKGFQAVFDQGRIFRSETQICSLPLVPEGASYSDNFETNYWGNKRLTGDNSRERPYAHLLPRLTTRSNTFTVHYTVQGLKKRPGTPPNVWDEDLDSVTSELRGSRTIERYIDPNLENEIPDYAASSNPVLEKTLDQFYRWRIVSNNEFRP